MILLPCPLCGSESFISNTEEPFVQCKNFEECNICGPWDDPNGEKWEQLAIYVMTGKLLKAKINIAYLGGMQWGWSTENGRYATFGTWEGCVKNAYKIFLEEER